jgi:hypothetical protein
VTIRNIQVFVDALALASGELPERAVFLVDDCPESTGRGTVGLCSVVAPGDLVRWNVIPIDLQAPAFIRALTFGGAPEAPAGPVAPEAPADPSAADDVQAGSADDRATDREPEPAAAADRAGTPHVVGRSLIWEGIVPLLPVPDVVIPYALQLAFTDRHRMAVGVAGPSLHVRAPGVAPLPQGSLLAAADVL